MTKRTRLASRRSVLAPMAAFLFVACASDDSSDRSAASEGSPRSPRATAGAPLQPAGASDGSDDTEADAVSEVSNLSDSSNPPSALDASGSPAANLPELAAPAAESDGSVSQSLTSAPSLGSASGFALLGASTVTCTNESAITGDVGVSPGTAITGFSPDCTVAGTLHAGDAAAVDAHDAVFTAFDELASQVCEHDLTGQDLGGQTLAPGVYCFDTTVGMTGSLTLDAVGQGDAAWIFQVGTALSTASNSAVVMAGGGNPCNVFWQVGSSATLGTGTAFQGNVLAAASVTLTSDSSLVGRAFALNAAVTSDHNSVSASSCSR